MGRAARTLYRLFLKEARRMNQENIQINMQMPMDVDAWMVNGGGHGWATPSPGKLPHHVVTKWREATCDV